MLKSTLVIIFYLLFISVFAQCPTGDVILESQAQVDDFVANFPACEIIEGDLIINPIVIGDIVNISGINSLLTINGSLRIRRTTITNTLNFDNLEFIGGDLEIENNFEIIDISGFNALTNIGGSLNINSNSANTTGLQSINAFNSLLVIGENFEINTHLYLNSIMGFNNLVSIDGGIYIARNDSLINLPNFNSLITIGIDLWIQDNYLLPEINGFMTLESIGALANLNQGGDFNIGQNPNLNTISGFDSLSTIYRWLKISSNNELNGLSSIPDFNSLEIVGGGLIIDTTNITSLSGFNSLLSTGDYVISTGSIRIVDNQFLQTINGFNNLNRTSSGLRLIRNNSLENINGFNNLITVGTDLKISGNASLENILGLNNLATIVFNLRIIDNNSLTSLTGLDNLISVGDFFSPSDITLEIFNNPSLIDCSAICNLFSLNGLNGLSQIEGNPTMCSSRVEIEQDCIPDFDEDGILNDDDLDDDNDGILDTVERNGDETRDTDSDGYPDHMDLDSDGDGCFDVIEAGFTDNDQNGTLGSLPDNVDTDGLIISEPDGYSTPLDNNTNLIFDFQEINILNAGESGILEVCIDSASVDLFDSLNGSPDIGGIWIPALSSGTGILNPSIDSEGIYTYTINNGVCGTNSSEVNVAVDILPNAGEDGTLELCESDSSVNLFTYLNGSPDTTGMWSPALSSGTGMFDPSIDSAGIYSYTVTNGICDPATAEVNIVINELPDAGENGSLEICINSASVNLFDSLNGSPNTDGIWTPTLSSGTDIFNPSVDTSDLYTYTVNNGVCGTNSSEVNVSVDALPNAGQNGNLELCESDSSVDLFTYLNGLPDTNGVWFPNLSSGTGIFDSSIDSAGIYSYTVTNGVCGSAIAEVNVVINELPNAGENGNLEICINSASIDLFDSLNGSPSASGVWTPILSSGSGILNPSVDASGIYTYTVNGGICGTNSSEVSVIITNVEPIIDYEFIITELSENNSIEIIINSSLDYQFSLDGFNYQNSNVFYNLIGGDYTVYVRETNGCGILEEEVTIIDYPKFFTPNNDGANDSWGIRGRTDRRYSILIYDRYGKLLKNLKTSGSTWDGAYNGRDMPTSDYWFEIVFEDGFTKTGHFTLKR